jgi:hypothetical protein
MSQGRLRASIDRVAGAICQALSLAVIAGVVFLALFLARTAAQDRPPHAGSIRTYGSASESERFFFDAANRERAAAGLSELKWDEALATAARKHAALMVKADEISHQFSGEPALEVRTSEAGAHFSSVGENVAVGTGAPGIQAGWMKSPGHRANILGAGYNSLGVGVVEARGELWAVEDFSIAVEALSIAQQEKKVAVLLVERGFRIVEDTSEARKICSGEETHTPHANMETMQYETSDLSKFPEQMERNLRGSRFHEAAVGACKPKGPDTGMARFRIVVLLY